MSEINLVPREAVSFERMAELADRMKWKLDPRSAAAAKQQESPEYVWRFRRGSVALVKNTSLRRDYFVIDAPDPQPAVTELQASFPCYRMSEIVAALTDAGSADDRIGALNLVAAAAPASYDDAVFQAIARDAEAPQPTVRLAAVTAANRLGWKQLRPVVQRVSDSDDKEVLRSFSTNVLNLTPWNRG